MIIAFHQAVNHPYKIGPSRRACEAEQRRDERQKLPLKRPRKKDMPVRESRPRNTLGTAANAGFHGAAANSRGVRQAREEHANCLNRKAAAAARPHAKKVQEDRNVRMRSRNLVRKKLVAVNTRRAKSLRTWSSRIPLMLRKWRSRREMPTQQSNFPSIIVWTRSIHGRTTSVRVI